MNHSPPHSDQLDIQGMLEKQAFDEFEKAQLQKQTDFFELHAKLREHMGWDDVQTKDWFYTKNPLIGNFTPLDYYGKRPDKCIRWVESLIDEGTL